MSMSLKLMIPLISNTLTKNDLSKEAGFVEAYTDDVNKPYLDHHIFLMYDYFSNTAAKFRRMKKFQKDKAAHSEMIYKIEGKLYSVYVYPIKASSANLKAGRIAYTGLDKSKIINFWGYEDKEVIKYLSNPYNISHRYEPSYVPEIDQEETKKAMLTLEKSQHRFKCI